MENASVCDALFSPDSVSCETRCFHWFSFLYFQVTAVQNLEHSVIMSQKLQDGWLDCVSGIKSDGFTELQSEGVSCCGSFMHAEPSLSLIGAQVSLQWLPNKFN